MKGLGSNLCATLFGCKFVNPTGIYYYEIRCRKKKSGYLFGLQAKDRAPTTSGSKDLLASLLVVLFIRLRP